MVRKIRKVSMGSRIEWVLVMIMIVLECCFGCLVDERNALLQIKADINYPSGSSLSTWLKEKNSDCCQWEGIECNPATRRVRSINLDFNREWRLGNWYLNASLFLSFEQLNTLSLVGNSIAGWVQKEDLDTLKNLKHLDMSENNITGFMRGEGSKRSTQLKFLVLDYMDSKNACSLLQSLGLFFTLKHLSFRGNSGECMITSQSWRNLTNLEVLILDYSYINKDFLQNMQVLTSLKTLSLINCSLSGYLPNQGWYELRNLKQLSFAINHLVGMLPTCMGNLTSLRVVDFSYNQLMGNIGLSPLNTLTSLKYLLFSDNQFQVPLSLKPFSNHSYLKVIVGSSNTLIADPILNTPTTLRLQLEVVDFRNYLLTHLDVAPTSFLYFQSHLKQLDLSDNNIGGPFPSWLLENSSRLEVFYLRNNTFVGPLALPSHSNYIISDMDISNNDFRGHIPSTMSSVFPNLQRLYMSQNRFEGNHLYHFSNMSLLSMLDLSNNQFSGMLEEHLAMYCPSLHYLKLTNNSLSGKTPSSFFTNLRGAKILFLDGNYFSGKIPNGISLLDLEMLDISNNQFIERIPKWLGNQSFLEIILISKNHLQGPIPKELCEISGLQFLDLSENNLTGSIPSCFSTSNILHLHAGKNKLGGPLPQSLFNSSSMMTLDLRENFFSGSIPSQISNVSTLSILLLRANHLVGNISYQLCHLHELSILDLSQNFLSGSIPPCLGNMAFKAPHRYEPFLLSSNSRTLIALDIILNLEGSSELSSFSSMDVQEEVKFATKNRYESYKGEIVGLMSGIDLSNNQLIGELPSEIGNISKIISLNFSHNQLIGSIPTEFSNLRNLESLDLSYNNLTGIIPPQLIKITSLEVFNIAHNNLSGKIPDMKDQFGTFEEGSYEGNPYLCGALLKKPCWKTEQPLPSPSPQQEEEDTKQLPINSLYRWHLCNMISSINTFDR